MNKSSTIKALLMITFIIITVIVFRHITFLSEIWNTVFLMMNVFSSVGKDVITQPVPLLQIPFLEAWGILIVHVLLALGIGWGIFYKKTRFTL